MQYLVSALEMGQLDQQTIEELGVPGRVLMETAGRSVAAFCLDALSEPGTICVACGPGNNGGDGFVTARALAAAGHRVEVFVFADYARIRGDAKATLSTLEKTGEATIKVVDDARVLWEFSSALRQADLAVDALLGTGIHDEVRGLLGQAIDVLNESSVPVVSVDIPSGVDADTGVVLGRAVEAHTTVTFAFPKRGHYLYPGAAMRGYLEVADIGIPRVLAEKLDIVGRLVRIQDGPALLAKRQRASHKGHFGHLVVVGGSPQSPGAAVLTLAGALRSGAGLVSWATEEATLARAPSLAPEVMLRIRNGEDANAWAERLLQGATAVVVGPGWTTDAARAADLRAILAQTQVPTCLDADALNLLAEEPDLLAKAASPLLITPHPKEMARLARTSVAEVQRDRFAAALQFAMSHTCEVVLKGAGTVIADPDGVVAVVDAGNPGLAAGGTGDVLAGVLGALLAQGLDHCTAARIGVLLHGAAADLAVNRHSETGLRARDVVSAMGGVLAKWKR